LNSPNALAVTAGACECIARCGPAWLEIPLFTGKIYREF
jgi:hypothetical protein